jgi:hypothetical protein
LEDWSKDGPGDAIPRNLPRSSQAALLRDQTFELSIAPLGRELLGVDRRPPHSTETFESWDFVKL